MLFYRATILKKSESTFSKTEASTRIRISKWNNLALTPIRDNSASLAIPVRALERACQYDLWHAGQQTTAPVKR